MPGKKGLNMRRIQRVAVVAAAVAGLSAFGVGAGTAFAGEGDWNGQAVTAVANSTANAVGTWGVPSDKAAVAPQAAPQAVPQAVPQVAPEVAPQAAPQVAPEVAPQVAPEAAPQAAPEAAPQAAPEAAPQAAPEAAPEAAPQAAPENGYGEYVAQ